MLMCLVVLLQLRMCYVQSVQRDTRMSVPQHQDYEVDVGLEVGLLTC
jgi:hypothetical protein